jgi:HSP20 family protein
MNESQSTGSSTEIQPSSQRGMFDLMQSEIEDLWSRAWPGMMAWPRGWGRGRGARSNAWHVRMDVFEKDGRMVVKADLPGIKREDIDVSLDRGDLVIRGERREEKEVKEEAYYRAERAYGSFYRRIPLPFAVSSDQVSATFKDGVLEVTVPIPAPPPEAQPKKIEVAG